MNVVFIQPMQFLRSTRKTNPYFDPLIHVVEHEDWSVWVPHCEAHGYGAGRVHVYASIEWTAIWFWRVIHCIAPWMSCSTVYFWYGRIVRPFWRHWKSADVIITIAGVLADILAGMYPEKRIVDVQHGTIFSRHEGYFDLRKKLLPALARYQNREFWLYGEGFRKCFMENPQNEQPLRGRINIVGDLLMASRFEDGEYSANVDLDSLQCRKKVVLVLQLTHDFDVGVRETLKKRYESFLLNIERFAISGNVEVVLRHHPRYADSVDLSDWKLRFPWLKTDMRSWGELYPETLCCVTINSTVVFEAAALGIPSLLIRGDDIHWAFENIMKKEYNYPLSCVGVDEFLGMSDVDRAELSLRVKDWYREYYEPFSKKNAHYLITKGNYDEVL